MVNILSGCGTPRVGQVTPQSGTGAVWLSLSQTWLTRDRSHSVIHPKHPPAPLPFLGSFPFSLKCLGYLAQSITLCKEQWLCVCLEWVGVGCVCMWWGWREGSGCEVGVRNRWLGSVCLSLSPWRILSKCFWQAHMHPPTCTRGATGARAQSRRLSPTQPADAQRTHALSQNTSPLRATGAP